MDKLLVTGITGFVGTNLREYLSDRFELIGLTRTPEGTSSFKSYKELTPDDFDSVKAVIHLAGKSLDPLCEKNPQGYIEANTVLTQELFDAFLKSDCKVFILMSSVKAAADVVPDALTEAVIPNPKTAFGKSKLAAEQYILSKLNPQKSVYILRPCAIHGPGMHGNFKMLYKLVQKGIPYPLGAFDNQRSFLSVTNLCFAIEEFLAANANSGIYHIADDMPISTNRLIALMEQGLGKKVKVLRVPKNLIRAAAKMGDFIPLPLSTKSLSKLTENYVVSNKKIKLALGKEFPLSTEEGILKTIDSL